MKKKQMKSWKNFKEKEKFFNIRRKTRSHPLNKNLCTKITRTKKKKFSEGSKKQKNTNVKSIKFLKIKNEMFLKYGKNFFFSLLQIVNHLEKFCL